MVISGVAVAWHHNYYLGLVVGLAMVTAITVAACMGVLVTAFLSKSVSIQPLHRVPLFKLSMILLEFRFTL